MPAAVVIPKLDLNTLSSAIRRFLTGKCGAGLSVSVYALTLVALWAATILRVRNFWTLTSSAIGLMAFALAYLLPFACFIFTLIGAFLSLRRVKQGKGMLRRNIAELAQLSVLATALPTALWATFDVPKSFRAFSEARGLLRETQWTVRPNGHVLHVTGPIDDGLAAAVQKALADNSTIRIVELDSPGGDVGEAMRVAERVRLTRLSTGVSRRCSSACTLIFAAGMERILLPSGKLGFHGCRDLLEYFYCWNSKEEDLLVDYGVDRAFVHKALEVPSQKIWFPTPAELLAAHVITSTTALGSRQQ
jgi:hypothetical protein